jgi:membrane protein implicated in regulation of membrane protease activity
MKKFILPVLTVLVLPVFVMAHHGHGTTDGFTITHYFTEPVHLITIAGVAVVSLLFIRRWIRKNKSIKLQQNYQGFML